ncbi:fatty acyl-CoA reductase 1-like [Gigantopelta aegis]|uniref:fatty acyl-CoA reductase 1-like n=1 Tax=Gigantopelta aegis TaxID=1735272 RepID=UPI001B887BD7|nr:fatty acyl-CoA reductase 1-like [Gigantopelta aegis]XP_041367399.1 fatty acyl-CoA reductase 1-like [Gigantopelta aegis]
MGSQGTLQEMSDMMSATHPKMVDSIDLSVLEFYRGKKIFITGATGFVGKVLIEKLFRSCPEIDKIYFLIRPKKTQDIYERTNELIQSQLYDKLRKDCPNFGDKLHPINGDISLPGLGISSEDLKLLQENVQIVFHSAATVRFDESLRVALQLNVLAVRELIVLAKTLRKLQVLVHVSTAYANCERPFIEEVVYPPTVDPHKLIDALEWMDDEMLEILTPKLLKGKPNTYTYTKHLAENILVTEGVGLPLAIVRPSIIGAAWKEPLPGWIDNYNGPSGLYIAAGKGVLRTMKGDYNAVADFIPVDIPVNLMICVAWYTAVAKPKRTLVYHSTTGGTNPFTWGEMRHVALKFLKHTPMDACFRRPYLDFRTNSYLHDYYMFVSHLLPAYAMDVFYRIIGKKPRMVRIYNRLHRTMSIMAFFTSNSWEWSYNNTDMLINAMSPEERKMFYLDPRPLHWPTYIENYILGTKKYLLKEDMVDVPAARAHLKKLRNIRYTFNTVLFVVLWRGLIARSEIARNLWYLIVSLVFKFVRFFRITSTMQR